MNKATIQVPLLLMIGLSISLPTSAGSFIFAGETNPDTIAHPSGYTGTGGELTVSVCIAPSSESIADMEIPVQNAIFSWNQLTPVSPNLFFGSNNDIPSGTLDYESTLVHEIGHCIGLAHPNMGVRGSDPGPPVSGSNTNFTAAATGGDGQYSFDAGGDGIVGSADDVRGDDVNLHWFNPSNDPFVLSEPVDSSNYSVSLNDLPPGDLFPANAGRDLGSLPEFPSNTEAVMQQGQGSDEDQRRLAVDDVATLRLGMSGLDESQGTADDYTPVLVYGGVQSGCDITVQVTGSSFAFCSVSGAGLGGNHVRINSGTVQMGSTSNYNWHFNQTELAPEDIFADGFES